MNICRFLFSIVLILLVRNSNLYAAFPIKNTGKANICEQTATTGSVNASDHISKHSFLYNVRSLFQSFAAQAEGLLSLYHSSREKKRGIAILLCLAPCFGLHRLYLGYTGSGIVQLCAWPFFGLCLLIGLATPIDSTAIILFFGLGAAYVAVVIYWQFIDLLRLICGGLPPKNGDYGGNHKKYSRHYY